MNLAKKGNSIEFVVDEASDELVALERIVGERSPSDDGVEVLRIPLSHIRIAAPAESQRNIGRLVLAFLNSRSTRDLKLPEDLEDQKKLDNDYFQQLERSESSPKAYFHRATTLAVRCLDTGSIHDFEQAEHYLNLAVEAGVQEAIDYKKDVWSVLEPRLKRKINPA